MVSRYQAQLGGAATVVACGGLVGAIVPHCSCGIIRDDHLLLDGLMALYPAKTPEILPFIPRLWIESAQMGRTIESEIDMESDARSIIRAADKILRCIRPDVSSSKEEIHMSNTTLHTKRLTQLSLLICTAGSFGLHPLGFIMIPPVSITVMHIPVIIRCHSHGASVRRHPRLSFGVMFDAQGHL
jgi:hypothetical protein